MNFVRIASRGSRLALWQAEFVKAKLAAHGIGSQLVIVKTTGDKIQNRFLHEIGGKGVFVKEIEECLRAGDADLAVHSLKDLPARTLPPFKLAAILKRHGSGDVMAFRPEVAQRLGVDEGALLTKEQIAAWEDAGLVVGTGSLRRTALLRQATKGLKVEAIRGNFDTRLGRLREGRWDAVVLAQAAFERVPIADDLIKAVLDPQWFVPSASQGALAVETLQDHPMMPWLQEHLACRETTFCVALERAILAGLGGDCHLPIGVHAKLEEGPAPGKHSLLCRVIVLDNHDGAVRVDIRQDYSAESMVDDCARVVLAKLWENGVNRILSRLGIAEIAAP